MAFNRAECRKTTHTVESNGPEHLNISFSQVLDHIDDLLSRHTNCQLAYLHPYGSAMFTQNFGWLGSWHCLNGHPTLLSILCNVLLSTVFIHSHQIFSLKEWVSYRAKCKVDKGSPKRRRRRRKQSFKQLSSKIKFLQLLKIHNWNNHVQEKVS